MCLSVVLYVTVPWDLKGLDDLGQFSIVPCSLYDHLACFIQWTKYFQGCFTAQTSNNLSLCILLLVLAFYNPCRIQWFFKQRFKLCHKLWAGDGRQHTFTPPILSSCFLPPMYFQISQCFHLFLLLLFLLAERNINHGGVIQTCSDGVREPLHSLISCFSAFLADKWKNASESQQS